MTMHQILGVFSLATLLGSIIVSSVINSSMYEDIMEKLDILENSLEDAYPEADDVLEVLDDFLPSLARDYIAIGMMRGFFRTIIFVSIAGLSASIFNWITTN